MVDVIKVKIPDEFLCPISYGLMTNPVILSDGHTYDKSSLKFIKSDISPINKCPVNIKKYVPNRLIKNLIDNFIKEHVNNKTKAKNKKIASGTKKVKRNSPQTNLLKKSSKDIESKPRWKF